MAPAADGRRPMADGRLDQCLLDEVHGITEDVGRQVVRSVGWLPELNEYRTFHQHDEHE